MRRTTSRRAATTRPSRSPGFSPARSTSLRRPVSAAERFRRETAHRAVAGLADRVPGRAGARVASANDEVAHVEMEVRGLTRAFRDLVDVEVERPRSRTVQPHLEGRLLARLPQCRRLERDVARLDVAAGLQQPLQPDVLDQARTRATLVDDEGRGCEVRLRLVARERVA